MERPPEDFDLLIQSKAALEAGDFATALAAAHEAIEVSRLADDRVLDLAKALRLQALALEAVGRTDEAQSAWSEARTFFMGLGLGESVSECDARLNA